MARHYPPWKLARSSVKRVPWLDAQGFYQLVALGPDGRELARRRVFGPDDEIRVAEELRAQLNDQTLADPAYQLLLPVIPCRHCQMRGMS